MCEPRAQTSADAREPASPAHPPRPAPGHERGLLRARAPPQIPSSKCFPTWPAWSLGRGPQKCGRSHLGEESWNCLSLPGPAGEFPNRETICGEGRVAGKPPSPPLLVPSLRLRRWASGGLGAAPLPISQPRGTSACLAAYLRRLDHAGCPGGLLCPCRVAGRPRAAGLFLSYQCRNAAAAAAAAAGGRRRRGPWAVRAALKGPPPHSARVEV